MSPSNETKNRFAGTLGLSRLLEKITKTAFEKRGFAEQRIITDWRHIVGDVIARYSTPLKLAFPAQQHHGGVLHIEVYDSAFATEIHYLGPMILDRIATYFGYRAVSQLKLTQKPMPWKEEEEQRLALSRPVDREVIKGIEDMVDDIKDEALQKRLAALGEAIAATEKDSD